MPDTTERDHALKDNYYANLEKVQKRILEFHDTARIVMARQDEEEALRNEYPSLMKSWEEYQVMLRLTQAGQLSR
jgi:hypothetical protein